MPGYCSLRNNSRSESDTVVTATCIQEALSHMLVTIVIWLLEWEILMINHQRNCTKASGASLTLQVYVQKWKTLTLRLVTQAITQTSCHVSNNPIKLHEQKLSQKGQAYTRTKDSAKRYLADSENDEDLMHNSPAVHQLWQYRWCTVQCVSKHDAHCRNPKKGLASACQHQLIMRAAGRSRSIAHDHLGTTADIVVVFCYRAVAAWPWPSQWLNNTIIR